MTPETRYAKSGDVHVAFQVTGDGPIDLVFVPGFVSHLEADWDSPVRSRLLQRLSSFCRLIRFDKRGTGLSDRVKIPTLEQRMDDVRAVMDAVGSQKAALFGLSDGGPMSICSPPPIRSERSAWSSTVRMRAGSAGRTIRTA